MCTIGTEVSESVTIFQLEWLAGICWSEWQWCCGWVSCRCCWRDYCRRALAIMIRMGKERSRWSTHWHRWSTSKFRWPYYSSTWGITKSASEVRTRLPHTFSASIEISSVSLRNRDLFPDLLCSFYSLHVIFRCSIQDVRGYKLSMGATGGHQPIYQSLSDTGRGQWAWRIVFPQLKFPPFPDDYVINQFIIGYRTFLGVIISHEQPAYGMPPRYLQKWGWSSALAGTWRRK